MEVCCARVATIVGVHDGVDCEGERRSVDDVRDLPGLAGGGAVGADAG
jgi:hypothetical protein